MGSGGGGKAAAGGRADGNRAAAGRYHRVGGGANRAANRPDLVIGLSSGTSMDGIDAALVAVGGDPEVLELRAYRQSPYDPDLREAIEVCLRRGSSVAVARLDMAIGEAFAAAAVALLEEAGVAAAQVRCIGSHGQTVVHRPGPWRVGGDRVSATLQVGEPSVIAERTGITTVADFRRRDMAAGGEGAPLVPVLDHRLYSDPVRGRVALNLGGIANVSALPPGGELVTLVAFDTGPGNVLLDAAARRAGLAGGIDADGRRASSGRVDAGLLERLLDHPFYRRRPPKSADRDTFLGAYAERCWQLAGSLSTEDLLRTLAELTARCVADAIDRFIAPGQPIDEVVVSGGGARNRAVLEALGALLAPAALLPADEVGRVSGEAKEAVLFALLGWLTLEGRPGNVPAATGASRPVVLGKIVPAC